MTADTAEHGEPGPLTLDTLRELLDEFADLPGDTPVILSEDAEGNGYSPLAGGDRVLYLAETAYSGEVYDLPEEDAEEGDVDEDDEVPEDAVPAVVLYPMN
ncbi:hypothetical protein [Streptomyces sp. G1]|uniref:hypothetical protein n=1 Tax=Streptomyces sp. G1 TaxID=361572 RepID=UPI00202F3763|nr:hypothetical protein [Streptomyces sp. G1]MCM1964814.1 hypothetical protein [Streptomyces sp. G1]